MSALPQPDPSHLDFSRPFLWSDARAAGIPVRRLRSAEFVSLFKGVLVARSVPRTLRIRTMGALLLAPPSAVVTHHTAVGLQGGTAPPSSLIHLTMSANLNCKVSGIRPHRLLRPPSAISWYGIPVTPPEQTFCDMASCSDLVDLVVLGDRFVRRGRTTPMRLRLAADRWDGRHAALVRRAAGLVRDRVDSPTESKMRMLMVLAGLPEPEVDITFRDPVTGDVLRRLDTGWRECKVAPEYDGAQHREDDEIWDSDILRHEQLREEQGWRIVRVTKKGMYDAPLQTLRRIEAARVDRGARPTRFRNDWQPYFPGKE